MSPEEIENRVAHHPPADEARLCAHNVVRAATATAMEMIEKVVPDGREKSLSMTNLEQAMFWANAGIARQP